MSRHKNKKVGEHESRTRPGREGSKVGKLDISGDKCTVGKMCYSVRARYTRLAIMEVKKRGRNEAREHEVVEVQESRSTRLA